MVQSMILLGVILLTLLATVGSATLVLALLFRFLQKLR